MIPVPMGPAGVAMCDGVLITHERFDHFHSNSYGPILENTDSTTFAPSSCFTSPQKDWSDFCALEQSREVVEPGISFELGDLTVHVRSSDDPDAVGDVSYVIEHESGTFFNGGDSRFADGFYDIGTEFNIDMRSLSFRTHAQVYYNKEWASFGGADEAHTEAGKLYMNENDVVKSANALQLDRLIPCRFDIWKELSRFQVNSQACSIF